MGRMYTVEFENVAVTAAQDFFEITPADDKPIKLHAIYLGQSSDVGDAEEEMLRIRVIRGHTTGGSGGTTPTPRPVNPTDPAAGFVSDVNNTTIASAGSPVNLHSEPFNIRTGYQLIFTPEMQLECSQGQTTIVVRLLAAPNDSLSMSGTLYVEELG